MKGARRALAAGGAIGPAAFVTTWVALGRRRAGYSSVHQPISQLAALGAPSRRAMTAAMIVDGVGIGTYGASLLADGTRVAANSAILAGLATIGAATFPLGTPRDARLHTVSAVVGYATVALTPIATAPAHWRARRRVLAAVSVATGVVSGALLAASLRGGPRHGLLQRAGLTLGDIWIAASAIDAVRP